MNAQDIQTRREEMVKLVASAVLSNPTSPYLTYDADTIARRIINISDHIIKHLDKE